MPACANYKISKNINLSKNVAFSGIQIPFDTLIYNYGSTFYLNDNKIYSSRHAIIQVDYVLNVNNAERSYYTLLGQNGTYQYVGGCSPDNGLTGSTLAGSFQFEINADEYITLMLGSSSIFENKTIYGGSAISVSIVRYLD